MRPFFALLLFLPFIHCMTSGDAVNWNERAYMVKVVSTVDDDKRYGCTGVRLTSSLVLTSSKCFKGVEEEDAEAIVISIRGNGTKIWKRLATDVKISDDYALVSISPRKHETTCLSAPNLPGVVKLPLINDLLKGLWKMPDTKSLLNQKCRIIGFETAHVDNYTTTNQLLQLPVTLEQDFEMVVAEVEKGKGPCYDDYGIPLECELETGEWTLVGMVQALTREAPEDDENPAKFCDQINGMKFSLFNDNQVNTLLGPSIDKILAVQKKCFSKEDDE